MIHLDKNILILVFICGIISISHPVTAGNKAVEQQVSYIVKFGDTYHNYSKEGYVRIGISFKNIKDNPIDVKQEIIVLNAVRERVWDTKINMQLQPRQEFKVPFMLAVPKIPGSYTLTIPKDSGASAEEYPQFNFVVIDPHKSKKLSLITVLAPDWEEDLLGFVDRWEIKAASISFGQAVLCGKKTLQRLAEGDKEAQQLIDRALKRDMSVIFLDFGPVEIKEGIDYKITLPYGVKVKFIKATAPELNFIPERSIKALNYDLPMDHFYSLNGINGISVPPIDMKLEGKDVGISNLATAGKNPFRFPIVELKPESVKGKIILCQVITDGRLDEKVIPPRNRYDLPAYDPFAVQFVLNLISASVGDDLLK
jgi:hypothetical protein